MNNWHGISVLLLLLGSNLNLFPLSEACEAISHFECVNSTHYYWCVDDADGTLVTIGDSYACPQNSVCDDTQRIGCVDASTVSNPETTSVAANPITKDTSTTVTDSILTISDADFICIYEGFYKANDCSRYHVCYKVFWFMKHSFARCSQGLYWSSTKKSCVLQSLSDCP